MKKILAFVLVVVAMFALVSCTKKAEDFEANLEDEDYEVEVTEKEKALKAAAKVLEETYDVDLDGALTYIVEGTNEDLDSVLIYCFEKSSDAKAVAEAMEEVIEDKEMDLVVQQDGKLVYVATSKSVIKDAQGK